MSDPARSARILLSLVIGFSLHAAAQTLTPASLSFGNLILGATSVAQSATLTNTQSVALTISSITTTGDFAATSNCPVVPTTLGAGANCKVFITFTPSALGARPGTLTIKDNAQTGSRTTTLTGTGIAPVALSATALWLGSQAIGTTSPSKPLTLKNNQLIPVTISGISASGDYRQTNTCPIAPASLGPAASCVINVTFTPTMSGSRVGTLSVNDNTANSPRTANLTGTGLIPVALSTTVLTFGSQIVNKTTAAQNITLRNNLPSPLTISTIASSGDFAVTTTCPQTPNPLAAGGSCALSITFNPTVLGPRAGTVSVTDNAPTSPQTINLQGNGTLAGLSRIALTPPNPTIAVGAQQQFIATGTFADGSSQGISRFVAWTSSNRGVATVATGGLVTAVAAGTATIAASYSGISGTSALTVSSGVRTLKSISVSPMTVTLAKGQTQQYSARGTYSDGTTADLTASATWRSSAPPIASVNPAGLATGLAAGTTTITAGSGSLTGSATLTVAAAPTVISLRVTPDKLSMAVGTLQQLTATGTYSDGTTQDLTGTVIWSSSSSVATVSSTGIVRGVNTGQATVTAALNSLTGSSAITLNAMTWQRYPSPAWDGPVSAIARATDGDIFLGANGTGVYKSSDGHAWTLMGSPAEPGIESLLWSATSLYAGTHDGVFMSTDGGRTWTRFGAGLRSGTCVFAVLNAKGAFFAATDQGLYRMPAGSGSWSAVLNGNEFHALFASSTGLLLAGTTSGGNGGGAGGDIFTSGDGVTWTKIGIANAWSFRSFGQDASGTLYAGAFFKCFSPGGIYISIDGGKTWTGPSLGSYSIQAITSAGSTVYLGTREGVLFSGPQTWQAVPNPSGKAVLSLSYPFLGSDGIYRLDDNTHPQLGSTPEVTQVLRDASGTSYWRSSYFGIWSSTDGYIGPTGVEAAWHLDNLMFLNAASELVVFEQATIYHRVGRDWIKAQFPISPIQGRFYCYAVFPDGSILVSDVNDRLWRSTDGGSSFAYSGTTASGGSGVLFKLLYANNALYAASELNNIIVSNDYGKTWSALPQFHTGTHNVNTYAVTVTAAGTLLGGRAGGNGDGSVFRYVNGVWQRSDKGVPAYQSVYALYSTPGAAYALTERALYQSVDDGKTWTAFNAPTFFPAYTAEFRPITMTTMDDGHLVLGVHWEGAGAYISAP